MKAGKTTIDDKISIAALRLIAARGWGALTLDALAKAAKLPLPQIKTRCADKNKLLQLIVSYVTSESFKACGKPDKKSTPHDRLFEVLMARFDVLQQHRKAILSLIASMKREPQLALALIPAQIDSMKTTLQFVGLRGLKSCPQLTPLGLWGIFMLAMHTWQSDETVDMSRTMAAIDRSLRFAEKAASLLRLNLN